MNSRKPLPMRQIKEAFDESCKAGWAYQMPHNPRIVIEKVFYEDRRGRKYPERVRKARHYTPNDPYIAVWLKNEGLVDRASLIWEYSPNDSYNLAVWEDEEGDYIAVSLIDGQIIATETSLFLLD
ncbi:hypothetical protein GF420_15715 [candidate division GN15 bacterium]|nr:hypothetical protein [candidate division GN15 bacterium]